MIDTPCYAARTGEGYWTCDVTGGCPDCRALAAEINDTDQRAQWDAMARVVADFKDPMHHDPARARGECFPESYRFVTLLADAGVHDAEVVSGLRCAGNLVLNGHAAVRVGDVVYDWTARQFWPHDQDVPLVQPYSEWAESWPPMSTTTQEGRA